MLKSTTIQAYVDEAEQFDVKKTDFVDKPFYFNDDATMRINGMQYGVTDWAVSQMCARFGPLVYGPGSNRVVPIDLIRAWLGNEKFRQSAARLLNDHIDASKVAGQSWFIRTYDGTIRAALSNRYAAIPNLDILKTTAEAVKELGLRDEVVPYQSKLTPDHLYLRFGLRSVTTDDGEYTLGAYIESDEIGKHRIKVLPLIRRGHCMNSMYFRKEDAGEALDATHRGAKQLLSDRVAIAIGHALKIGVEGIRRLLQTRTLKIENFLSVVDDMAKEEGWTVAERDAVLVGTEGKTTVFGLVNGLSYVGHTLYEGNQERMGQWQERAGDLVFTPVQNLLPKAVLVKVG